MRQKSFAAVVLAGLVAGVAPSLADPAAPAQQSGCEIRAIAFKAQHSHIDPVVYFRLGFFPFGGTYPPNPPFAYRDPETGITFYVESDGRHLAAIDPRGRVLWVRNPFVDADMCPYRSAHPFIAWIGPPGGRNALLVKQLRYEIAHGRKAKKPTDDARFIGIAFNSSQAGDVDIATGEFIFRGQD